MEVFNQFCPCYIYYSNLLSMPNTGAGEEMFDSTRAAGSSSHPFELLTVSQSCLLAAADPGRNRPVCVADVPKDKAVAIMSSLTNALLETTMSTCLCAQCEKASWGRQMIIAAYKTRDSSFPHKKREKLEKKEAITVFILCSFASPTQFQGNKKIIVLS